MSQNPASFPEVPQNSNQTRNVSMDDTEVISKLRNNLIVYRTDVAERNTYIDTRDRYLYGDGLFEGLYFPDGFDQTSYNYLQRVVDIHAAQLMGQNFRVSSWYDQEDLTQLEQDSKDDPQAEGALKQAELRNKQAELRALGRNDLIEAIIRDNGGHRIFKDGARAGSAYGSTLYQMWWDRDDNKISIQLLESVQNWFPIWEDNNFREREGDAYVMQISLEKANREYAHLLSDGESFPVSFAGDPLINIQGSSSTLTNQQGETVSSATTRRPMVTVIVYTGYLPNVKFDRNGAFSECADGDETLLHFKSVGNLIASKIAKEDDMPRFYYVANRTVPRRPYGESDLPKSALDINQTIVQQFSNELTLANKTLFPIVKAKNFEVGTIPPRKQREISIMPMGADQDLEVLAMPTNSEVEFERIHGQLRDSFVRVTGVTRPLFDDPSIAGDSNAATLTLMRPIIDIVEDKQSRWNPVLIQMFTDALHLVAKHDANAKDLVETDDNWFLYVRWPSVLRKEDPAHQAMLLNDFMHGLKSVDTYLEERGVRDVQQEISRIATGLKDKVRAAIMGNRLGELAQFTIYEALGVPLWGFNVPKISLKGDLTPQQEGNIGALQGWNKDDQPFGASIGPQGAEGTRANEDFINQGFSTQNPYVGKYGYPTGLQIGQPLQPGNPAGGSPAQMMQGGPGPVTNGMPGPNSGRPMPPMIGTPGQQGPQPSSVGSGVQAPISVAGKARQSSQRKTGRT